MGKYSANLLHVIRALRASKRVKWPRGFKGMVMWCPNCAIEIARVAEGHTIATGMQQALVDAHNECCPHAKLLLVGQK